MPKIVFLLLPEVHLLDLAGPEQVFLEAKGMAAPITMQHCSVATSVNSSAGMKISGLLHFSRVKINEGDYIIIPGCDINHLTAPRLQYLGDLSAWLKKAYLQGANICSVCSAAFILARAGLLDGKKCTTHWKRTKQLQQEYPLVKATDDILFTEDDRIFTSAGVTAGIDLALHIVSRITNENFSFKVARELVVFVRRQGNDNQQSPLLEYRNHIHTGVHKVQDYVTDNLNKKITVTGLSTIANMSSRNLTRVFKKETGITINNYITLIRKEYLKKIAGDPDISRPQIAGLLGLRSERHVIRLLKGIAN